VALSLVIAVLSGCAGTGSLSGKRAASDPDREYRHYETEALRRFNFAEMYFMGADYPRAILEYQAAEKIDSSSHTIQMRLAESFLNIHKYEDALRHYKKAMKLDPESREYRNMAAQLSLVTGDLPYAESQWLYLIEKDPDFRDPYFHLFEVYSKQKDSGRAQDILKKRIQSDASDTDAIRELLSVLKESGQRREALQYAMMLVKAEPEIGQNWYAAVQLQLELENGKAAERLMEEWKAADENAMESSLFHANYLISENRPEEARNVLKPLRTRWQENWWISHLLALSFEDSGPADSTAYHYRRAMEGEGATLLPFQAYSIWALRQERYSDAAQASGEGLSRDSSSVQLRMIRASAYMGLDDLEKAIADYAYLHDKLPTDVNIMHQLALLYDRTGRYSLSDMLYSSLLQIDSLDHLAMNNYSYSLVERDGDLDKALDLVNGAIELNPGNPAYYDTKAWILFKAGDLETALNYMRKALDLSEANAEMYYHQAEILLALGKWESAVEYLQKAYDLDPDFEPASKRLKELRQ